MKNFEAELPQGYVLAKTVDAKSKKTAIIMNLVALLIMAVVFAALWLIIFGTEPFADVLKRLAANEWWQNIARLGIFLASYVAYIVLHELTHGIAYKALTKQKLTFGLTLSVAYCGVPNIYVYRRCALIALLAPFVVFDVVFALPIIFVDLYAYKVMFAAMLAMHVGGCVGDLYDTALYAFLFRDKNTLMRDTGPKQTFYVSEDSKLGQKILQQRKTDGEAPTATEEPVSTEAQEINGESASAELSADTEATATEEQSE